MSFVQFWYLGLTHLGMNIGLVVCVVYLSEVTTASFRGTMVSAVELCINGGHLLLFGLVVPLKVDMAWVEALIGLVHIVIIYIAGWAAAWQVDISRRLAFLHRLEIEEARGRTEDLLRNILPEPIAERLLRSPETIAEHHPSVTVLFADIVNGFLLPWNAK